MEEPCIKKQKLNSPEEEFQIKPILSDDFCNPIQLESVLVTKIKDKKSISSVILELNRCLPLPTLQHLKRVRQNEIILCKTSEVDKLQEKDGIDKSQVVEYLLSFNISNEIAKELSENLSIVKVASKPTQLRWQYETMNKLWPCKFHPNKYMESLYDGSCFTEKEVKFHCRIASSLMELSNSREMNFGMCIDPRTNSVVAVASGKTNNSPLMHCSMILIDFVARSQNGGAWQYENEQFCKSDGEKISLRGIPEDLFGLIGDKLKQELRFGAEVVRPKECHKQNPQEMLNLNNLDKYGPYLCTGYDVYLTVEPCLMCAMALLHSRVRRIFYLQPLKNGALESKIKLHTIKNLNHHFEVFRCLNEKITVLNKCL